MRVCPCVLEVFIQAMYCNEAAKEILSNDLDEGRGNLLNTKVITITNLQPVIP